MQSPARSASKRIADDVAQLNCKESLDVTQTPTDDSPPAGAVSDFGSSQRSAIPGGRGLRFHHNFVDSLTVRENFSVKFILMRKSVRVFVGELGCR